MKRVLNLCKVLIIGALLMCSTSFALERSAYTVVAVNNSTALASTNTKKVLVTEFFSYACPHCYHLEPLLEKWALAHHKAVTFQKVPVSWEKPRWQPLARDYYVVNALGLNDTLSIPIFKALHEQGLPLYNYNDAEAFFAKHGVKPATFKAYYHSPTIDQQLLNAKVLVKTFAIVSVPTIIVNGQYQTSILLAGSPKKVIKVLTALVAKSRKTQKGSA